MHIVQGMALGLIPLAIYILALATNTTLGFLGNLFLVLYCVCVIASIIGLLNKGSRKVGFGLLMMVAINPIAAFIVTIAAMQFP